MNISIEFLALLITLVITIATFLYSRFRDAEGRGRLLQRIDNLEKELNDVKAAAKCNDEKLGEHDGDIVKLTADIDGLTQMVERMDKKLDRLIEKAGLL